MKGSLYGAALSDRRVPPTRVLWHALRLAKLGPVGRSVILRHIRRETGPDAPLGALLIASGAVE